MKLAPESSAPDLPDKLYFRIGEVSRIVGVQPYVLRYWEKEFPSLAPKKSGKGHRLYRRKDVETFLQIKALLYENRFTIEGARKCLEARSKTKAKGPGEKVSERTLLDSPAAKLEQIRRELAAILELLK